MDNQESNTNFGVSCQQSNTNVEYSPISDQPSNTPRRSDQVIYAVIHGGQIIAPNACFSADDDKHNVMIILMKNEQEGGRMRLFVDGVMIYQVAITRRKTQGHVELCIDRKTVEFFYDLNQAPLKFFFRTKIDGGGGSEIYEEASKWVEGYYTLLILGAA
ncbi:hypothetical protein IEQ34_009156 [Dendrobium chrysotoxum]|uniref:Galectin n=1 Tax=Dendrobium chrysotoxum TaxID=161865 RepID=A0AAV7GXU1_DENCH|nr:hypothetical protein IEQ34_009156 [Dendrobium chrysotoxum]